MAEDIAEENIKMQCMSMLYALMDKFGDEVSKKKLKEVIIMTEIGKMIRDEALKEGIKEGIKEGETKGKADILIKQLLKKFKKLPEDYIKNIKLLSEDALEVIATDIFELEKVEDLSKYF